MVLASASFMRRLLTLLVAGTAVAATAGTTLDESLLRHRAGLAGMPRDRDAEPVAPHAWIGFARALPPAPALLARPVQGDTGVQWLFGGARDGGWRWRFGGLVRERRPFRADLDGSELSVPFGPGRAYASMQRRHWGPAWSGSLVLDGSARAVPAVGWRKTAAVPFQHPWLAWLGPWRGDAFIGQLANSAGQDGVKLVAARLEIAPLPGLEVGFARVMQWGGEGRPESLRSLLRGVLGSDNVDGSDRSEEPGNQLAGLDARWTLRPAADVAFGVYGQAIGEDEAQKLPSLYLGSAGLDLALAARNGRPSWRVFGEVANTVAGGAFGRGRLATAYRHPLYPAGYVQRDAPLGHPAGGDVHLATLGALLDAGRLSALVMAHRGSALAATPQFPQAGRVHGLDAEMAWRLPQDFVVGVSLAHWRDAAGRRNGLQLQWRVPLP